MGQPAPAESDAGDRRAPRQLQVLPKVQSSGSGAMPRGAAYWPPSERMPAKKKNARVEFGTGNRHVPFFRALPA